MTADSAEAQPWWSALLALQQATHRTLHVLSVRLAGLGLTGSETNALAHLADGRRWSMSELSAAAGSPPTTLTSVLDRLEGRGLVARGSAPGDRRVVLIELTASGREAAAAIRAAIGALERQALGSLPAAAIAGLRNGLQALTEVTP
ncbi:MAG TPA: MarR family transcriptional regulator [Streptosporangiaceae bacterium]